MSQVTKRRRPRKNTSRSAAPRARRRSAPAQAPASGLTERQRTRVLAGLLLLMLVFTGWLGGFAAAGVRATERAVHDAIVDAGFVLQHVDVAGADEVDEARVRAALLIEPGEIIFNVDPVAARSNLRRLDWVRDASVVRLLPNRLVVVIDERRPLALWRTDTGVVVLDQDGGVISGADPRAYAALPMLEGEGAPAAAAELVAALADTPDLARLANRFERVGERRWDVVTALGARIRLPETSARAAMAKLAAFHAAEKILSAEVAVVDLRGEALVVRPLRATFSGAIERGA